MEDRVNASFGRHAAFALAAICGAFVPAAMCDSLSAQSVGVLNNTVSDGDDGFGGSEIAFDGDTVRIVSSNGYFYYSRSANWGAVAAPAAFTATPCTDPDRHGLASIYERNIYGQWGEAIALTEPPFPDQSKFDHFGISAALCGDTLLVGAPGARYSNPGIAGAVFIYGIFGGHYQLQAEAVAADAAQGDTYGKSVALSGDLAAIGAAHRASSTGATYLIQRDQGGPSAWGQSKQILAADGVAGDNLGTSIAADGDLIVVGAPKKNGSIGATYLYGRNQGGTNAWGQIAELIAADGAAGDAFGTAVSVSGDIVVVGASGKAMNQGAAYVFQRDQGGANQWGQMAKLSIVGGAAGDAFGTSVAVSRNTAVVGASGMPSGTGATYIFLRNQGGAGNWGTAATLHAADATVGDAFGTAVAIDGDTVLVGARGKDSGTGAAYVYSRDLGGTGAWGQAVKLAAADAATGDGFGTAVAVRGDTALVGAPVRSTSRGAAYLFSRGADTIHWKQVIELTAPDAQTSDNFGAAVAVSYETALVGARGHHSNTGAAYLFQFIADVADIVAQPASLTFSPQPVGTTTAPQPISVRNPGTGDLKLLFSIANNNPNVFAVDLGTCPATLPYGSSCEAQITFKPVAAGSRTAQLRIFGAPYYTPVIALSGTGTAPVAKFTPSSLSFPGQGVGTTSAAQTMTLSNGGNAPLTVSSITISGDFAQTNNCPTSLAPSANCAIKVTFSPSANGTRSGNLNVQTNVQAAPYHPDITGAGIGGVVNLSPNSLSFNGQPVGTTSAPQVVTLTNTGYLALSISSISVSNGFQQTNNCPASLVVNANCMINVSFKPVMAGAGSGTLQIVSNAYNNPTAAALSGTGQVPGVSLSPTSLNFTGQPLGTTSAPQGMTLTNTGTAPMNISSIIASGDFQQTSNCPASLAATAHCTINVTFKPSAAGTRNGVLTISTNAAGSPNRPALSGTGIGPTVGLNPTSLSFASLPVGTTSAAKTMTLTNTGNADLSINSIAASGDFQQSNNCPALLAASANCLISVTFKPTATGTRNGILTIQTNAPNSPNRPSLSGTGS